MSTSDGPDELRHVRLARNQALFREVNERVEAVSRQHASTGPLTLVCECAAPDCADHVLLSVGEYEAVRTTSTHFLVVPGHIFPEVEIVVETHRTYVVVEKLDAAGTVATASDSRRQAG